MVAEVQAFLREGVEAAVAAGIERDRLCVDPGIGFGKTLEHNLMLLREIDAVAGRGRPLLVGPSRKSFIGKLDRCGGRRPSWRERPARWHGWRAQGVEIVRVHDVREMRQVVQVVDAIAGGVDG